MANTSSQPTTTQSKPEGTTTSEGSLPSNSFASEVASLREFISSPPTEEDATSNLASLLQHLDIANGMAQGVETKLDKLLGNLEGLLEGLEGKDGVSLADSENGQTQPKTSQPPQESDDTQHTG